MQLKRSTLGIYSVRSGCPLPLVETPVEGVRHMLQGKRARMIKVHTAAFSISVFKASIWKWLCTRLWRRPNLDQRQPQAGAGEKKSGRGSGGSGFGACAWNGSLCNVMSNLCLPANVDNNKWRNLSINFFAFTLRLSIIKWSLWCDLQLCEMCLFQVTTNGVVWSWAEDLICYK